MAQLFIFLVLIINKIFGKNGHELLLAELETAETIIKLTDELLAQKNNEIAALKEIITLMEK